jgi:hypothetical protein
MLKMICLVVMVSIISLPFLTGPAGAQQFPILDEISNKVVQKYQQSSCEQLWEQKAQKKPKSPREQEVIQLLHTDATMRAEFFRRVSVPIAEKMFDCGMIP